MFFEAPAIGGYAPIRWSRRAIARQAIRAPIALFRPLGSIRALARLCAHMRCAHTPRFLRSAAPSDTHAIPRFLRSAAPSH